MLMSTDPGDLVLDPTCGSGTTAYVAEQWGRRWITIDTSRVALALARQRLMGARFPYYLLADSAEGRAKESELSATPLPPAESTDDIRHGFVYERVQHITLKSIANNPDIKEGMSREEIDAAIKRHADFELLYDKPYEDKKKVRVAGPFTVESLSPAPLARVRWQRRRRAGAVSETRGRRGRRRAELRADRSSTTSRRPASRTAAGSERHRRSTPSSPTPATYIQAIGERDGRDGRRRAARVGDRDRPAVRHGRPVVRQGRGARGDRRRATSTCSASSASRSTRRSLGDRRRRSHRRRSDEGFANVAAERKLGRIPVLLVRMNADLLMGEELKKTGAGNLFTVFGEPDIEIERRRRRAASSSSGASTSTTRPPARSAATTPTRSRCG